MNIVPFHRAPALRLELQQRASIPIAPEGQESLTASCEADLRDSLALAQQFNQLRESGRIGYGVTYGDFVEIARLAREWPSVADNQQIIREDIRESD